ncbi:MAG TPA: SRPBCC domain-containing protein [Solirubrobacteraceae bacterium]|nr:SRPBCC domain-containing protein [Solirubrobacteraceae bacterium]
MPDAIHQEITIDADPARVYAALTDPAQFGELTGRGAAALTADAGAPFSLFDGHITGRNVELVPDRRLVQAWRAASWPEGVYSIVNFKLERDGGEQTRLVFDHTGFPAEAHDELAAGWDKMYWEPLRRYLS